MRIEGHNNEQINAELGIAVTTLYQWWCDPKIKGELDRLEEGIDQIFQERMANLGMSAMKGLQDIITEGHDGTVNVDQRLDAIKTALDRVSPVTAKVPVATAVGPQVQINNSLTEMTEEQLLAQAQRLAGEITAGADNENVVDADVVDDDGE